MATSQAPDTVDSVTRVRALLIRDIERINDLKALLAAAERQVERQRKELAVYHSAGSAWNRPYVY